MGKIKNIAQIVGFVTALGGTVIFIIGLSNWFEVNKKLRRTGTVKEEYGLVISEASTASQKKFENEKRVAQIMTFSGCAGIAISLGIFATLFVKSIDKVKGSHKTK